MTKGIFQLQIVGSALWSSAFLLTPCSTPMNVATPLFLRVELGLQRLCRESETCFTNAPMAAQGAHTLQSVTPGIFYKKKKKKSIQVGNAQNLLDTDDKL